jgi:acyl dehydratase
VSRYFEDYKLDDTMTSGTRTITEADIVNFAGLSGDFHELHKHHRL